MIPSNSSKILNEVFDCIFQLDQSCTITFWNKSIQTLTGINQERALGASIYQIIPSLEQECSYYFEQAVLKEKRTIELQLLKIKKPISQKDVLVKARFLPEIEEGETIGLFGILKVYHSEGLAEKEYLGLLESVVLNTNDAILITQPEPVNPPEGPKIIFSNPAFTSMTGYEAREVLGLTPRILQGEDTSSSAKKKISEGLQKWGKVDCEILNYKKSGEKFWVDLGIVPVKNDEGFYTHWVAIQRDVTEKRKNYEKLNHTNQYLEEQIALRTDELESFTYYLAHDAKQPTRNIISFANILQENAGLNEDSKTYLKYIVDSGHSLMELIKGLERLTILGSHPIQKEAINLSSIVEQEVMSLKEHYPSLEVNLTIPPTITVFCDAALMRNAIQNILSNSFKYFSREIPLEITVLQREEEYNVVLEIKDNGNGFDYGNNDPFALFHRGNANKQKGFGIGLALCKKIVQKHDGNIYLESATNVGTSIRIELPK